LHARKDFERIDRIQNQTAVGGYPIQLSAPANPFAIITPGSAHAAELAIMWRRSIEELCTEDHHGDPEIVAVWTANKTPEYLGEALGDRSLLWFVALHPGNVLSGVGLSGQDGIVRAVYVHPEFTGRGVGSALMQVIENAAKTSGISLLQLESTATARPFYRHHGFTDNGPSVIRFGVRAYPMTKHLLSTDA